MSLRSVLVTGASRGLGLEFVRQIIAQKDPPKYVFAACRSPQNAAELQALAKENSNVIIIKLDVTDDSDIDSAVEQTRAVLKNEGLNLLINNVGISNRSIGGDLQQQMRNDLQSHFDTNVSGKL